MLLSFVLPAALAAAPGPAADPAVQVFAPFAALGSPLPPPSTPWGVAPPAGDGSRLLDVYRHGDLAILHDADGEWLSEATTYVLQGDLNWVLESLSSAFYKSFGDDYQYLNILLVRDLGFFFAFYQPLANDVTGIGYDNQVGFETFDSSANQLEGFIFMNAYTMWYDDPVSGRYVFGQEFMHRWGAFVEVQKDGLEPDVLLGRDTAHWSYWLDTPNSPMEGNRWVDQGDGTWAVDYTATSTYSDLDLYLMGFVGPDEVPPSTLLLVDEAEQAAVGRNPTSTPEFLVESTSGAGEAVPVVATPITVTVDDVIAAEGPRSPSVDTSPKDFRMAFLVLVLSNDTFDDQVAGEVDQVRLAFEADWEEDVRGLADLDTTLGDGDAPTWGEPVDTGTPGDTGAPDEDSGDAVADDDGSDDEDTAAGCGCASSPGSAGGVALGLAALALARRRRTA